MAGLIRRGKYYTAVYTVCGKERRKALGTTSYQVAKAELRKLTLRLVRDEMDLYPTKTPLVTIIEAYVEPKPAYFAVRDALLAGRSDAAPPPVGGIAVDPD